MLHTLENEFVKITADTRGAELYSITGKKTGTEFLWEADPAHWGYHAPVLFPIIGRLKDDTYRLAGKTYQLGKHGFARTSEFELAEHTEDTLVFELAQDSSNEKYPFALDLKIGYKLEFNELLVTYSVENTGDTELYFSIGGHPAFRCPLAKDEQFTDYYLEFNRKEQADTLQITPEGYFGHGQKSLLENENKIPLDYSLFADDALVFDGLKSESVTLKSKNHKNSVSVSFEGFPMLGVWTKQDAPFVCIEPWFGHADFEDFEGELSEKDGIIALAAGKTFTCGYTIGVFEAGR